MGSVFDGLASVYDRGMLPLEWLIFRRLRRRIYPHLRGDVLELGVGTGVNLPLYSRTTRVVGCDPSRPSLTWAAQRLRPNIALVEGDAQQLPFPAASFDVVTASLTFCSVPEPGRGLREARRVLRAGGQLVLLEHMRGIGLGAWLTEIFHPLWHRWSRECHLNRHTVETVEAAGFHLLRVERHALGVVRIIEATTRSSDSRPRSLSHRSRADPSSR